MIPGRIERQGIEFVESSRRSGGPHRHFWLWLAANLNPFVITTGLLVMGLGLPPADALLAIIIGTVISYPLVGLVAVAGVRGGAPTMTLSRATFGYHGNRVPSLLAYVACVGWGAITLFLAASAVKTLIGRLTPQWNASLLSAVGLASTALMTIAISLYGYALMVRAQRWITGVVAITLAVYCGLVGLRVRAPAHWSAPGGASVVEGITLVVAAGGIAWVMVGADYSRYLSPQVKPSSVVAWTTLGGATAPLVLMPFGLLLGVCTPGLAARAAVDPLGALVAPLPAWFCVPFLIVTILGFVGSGVVNLYSSGLNLLALGATMSRPAATLINGVFVVLAGSYLVFLSPAFSATFESFLSLLGVPLAAWCAIFLIDFYCRHRQGYRAEYLYRSRGGTSRFNPLAMCVLSVSTLVGFALDHVGILGMAYLHLGIFGAFLMGGALYLLLLGVIHGHRFGKGEVNAAEVKV